MSARTKFIVGTVGVLAIVTVAGIFFLRYQLIKSFPETNGSIVLPGLYAPVEVIRDEYGVPRIEAGNERDLLFALGFVHAQDRLWQMDMVRRVAEGRLSEILGVRTVPFDRMFRIIGIRKISDSVERTMSAESRNRLTSYAAGVNAFINAHKGKYPVEFDLLGYEPEPWLPINSVEIARLMAWELNMSWWVDLVYGAIVDRVGKEKAADIFPSFPAGVPPTVPASEWKRFAAATSLFLKTSQDFLRLQGGPGILGGSNAWVIAPAKSVSQKVILANDIHLRLQAPSRWYEVHLSAPDLQVSGVSLPGVPGVVIGQNHNIAWGLTNVMADDADFYIERLNPEDSTQYFYEGRWLPLSFRDEAIKVKGDSTLALTIRSTHHGPIVTDIATPIQKTTYPFVASMRWTGYELSDQIEAFYRINRARNWDEFLAGVREFSGPGQNFVYGDRDGNIGHWCGLKLPIRSYKESFLPQPGWESRYEWKGFVPFEKLPHLYNPREGFIATANNKLVDDEYPYHISDLWEPASRIVRIREVLGRDELFSVEDFERLQNDKFSHFAKELTPYILAAYNNSPPEERLEESALEYLRNWDFVFTAEDIVTSIFEQFFVELVGNIYGDELGAEIFHDFVLLNNIPIRVTMRLLEGGASSWFDDILTEERETAEIIIRKSLRSAIAKLQEKMGSEMKGWRWGTLHKVALQHPFGLRKPLDKIFNIGPFPYGGGQTTLVSGEYSFTEPFGVTVGASFRQVVDLSKPYQARRIIPAGQSGQVLHKHYDDQTQLWLNGAYKRSVSGGEESEVGERYRLRLEPEK